MKWSERERESCVESECTQVKGIDRDIKGNFFHGLPLLWCLCRSKRVKREDFTCEGLTCGEMIL